MPYDKSKSAAEEANRLWESTQAKLREYVKAGKLKEVLIAMGNLGRYSIDNAFLIKSQMPTAKSCQGVKAWNQMGRHVRKGEHGLVILAPVMRTRWFKAKDGESQNRFPALPGREPAVRKGERETEMPVREEDKGFAVKVATGFRLVRTFDVSQTEGAPITNWYEVKDGNVSHADVIIDAVGKTLAEAGYSLSFVPQSEIGSDGADGVTDYKAKTVKVRNDFYGVKTLNTLFHEAGHALTEAEAMKRRATLEAKIKRAKESGKPFDGLVALLSFLDLRPNDETDAEAVACVLGQYCRLPVSDSNFSYMSLWAGDRLDAFMANDRKFISAASQRLISGIEREMEARFGKRKALEGSGKKAVALPAGGGRDAEEEME